MQSSWTVIKRIAIVVAEILVEAFLLGSLLGAMISHQIGIFNGMLGSIIAVPVILALHGYYISRVLSVIARASKTMWLYPCVASLVFAGHNLFAFWGMKSDLSPTARSLMTPFLVGGACIVFACALAGTFALRKWTPTYTNFADDLEEGLLQS